MAIFNLFSKFLPEICSEDIAEEILFVFCLNPGFLSNKPTHDLLDHGDYNYFDSYSASQVFKYQTITETMFWGILFLLVVQVSAKVNKSYTHFFQTYVAYSQWWSAMMRP